MQIQVFKNKLLVDFDLISEFGKAAEKAINDIKFIYLSYDGKEFTMFSEEGSMGSIVVAKVKVAPEEIKGDLPYFSAGVEAIPFLSFVKKLYSGFITIKMGKKSKLLCEEDNIKGSFPIVSPKAYFSLPTGTSLSGEHKDWIVNSLIDCLSSVEEASKSSALGPFPGMLLDTTDFASRICKFSNISLYLSSNTPVFAKSCRLVISDNIAKIAKAFQKSISEIIFTENSIGLFLKHGTVVYNTQPEDAYPLSYIAGLNLTDSVCMIPNDLLNYVFETPHLLNAVDLVATTLGDAESWVTLAQVGETTDNKNLVWKVSGHSFKGLEVQEEVLSSLGKPIDPFSVNKKRMLRCLSVFEEEVKAYDLSSSALALSNDSGTKVALLIKANV